MLALVLREQIQLRVDCLIANQAMREAHCSEHSTAMARGEFLLMEQANFKK